MPLKDLSQVQYHFDQPGPWKVPFTEGYEQQGKVTFIQKLPGYVVSNVDGISHAMLQL